MAAKRGAWGAPAAVLLATLALPLVGALARGDRLPAYLHFPPPLEIPATYPRFSWLAAGAVAVLLAALVASWAIAVRARARSQPDANATPSSRRPNRAGRSFPWWGWLALAWIAAWWVFAWNRFGWFAPLQRTTFFPLWFGLIVAVNAMIETRSGTCLMRRAPSRWLALFVASAGFWWIFEWLNRFARNWHYLGVDDFTPAAYAAHATLSFSTVLPAVAGVREWIGTFRGFERFAANGPAWRWLDHAMTGRLLIVAGAAALLLTGFRPEHFYPALWLAPLALAWGLSIVRQQPGTPVQISRGDWQTAAPWMIAALICGFWWELWNWQSLAKWIYTVPYVERWHIFEMPLLGYAGYLPFGLECLLVTERIIRDEAIAPRT